MAESVLLDHECSERVMARYFNAGTWRALAAEMGINHGLLWQVAHGKSRSNAVRVAVSLPPLSAIVTPCPDCGAVHKRLKTCDGKRVTKRRHRRAAGFATAHRARQFDAMLSERDTTLTDWMNKELSEWLK